jgi:hypothetical protein
VKFPAPEPGLVIQYAFLWRREYDRGLEEGSKARPCAIVVATRSEGSSNRILVVPITHSPPAAGDETLEIPQSVKRALGLDSKRSWIVLNESNVFSWPGPDLRRIENRAEVTFAYGHLPPRLFSQLKHRFVALERLAKSRRVTRTD